MSHDFFGSADRRKSEFAAGTTSDEAPFNEALARLFHAASEAGSPPPHLRAMLAIEQWSPIAVPESAVCATAASA